MMAAPWVWDGVLCAVTWPVLHRSCDMLELARLHCIAHTSSYRFVYRDMFLKCDGSSLKLMSY